MLARLAKLKTVDQWKSTNSSSYRNDNDLAILRKEIVAIENRLAAINTIATIDGYMTLPVVLQILREMQQRLKVTLDNINQNMATLVMQQLELTPDALQTFAENITTENLTKEVLQTHINDLISPIIEKEGIKLFFMEQSDDAQHLFRAVLRETIVVLFAIKLFMEVDKRQIAARWKQALLMGRYSLMLSNADQALKNPFICLQHAGHLITLDEQTSLWKELALWLDGMYARTFDDLPQTYQINREIGEVKKLEKGSYPLTVGIWKEDDQEFFNHFKVTFCDFALTYYQAARVIGKTQTLSGEETKDERKENQHDVMQEEVVVSSDATLVSNENKEDKIITTLPLDENTKTSESKDAPQEVIEVQSIAPSITTVSLFNQGRANKIATLPVSTDENEQILGLRELTTIDKANLDEKKFTFLLSYLKQYKLNNVHKSLLDTFSGVIIAKLKRYPIPETTLEYLKSCVRDPRHDAIIKNRITDITKAKGDVIQQIQIVFDLWNELVAGGSNKGKEIVVNILRTVSSLLYEDAVSEQRQINYSMNG